MRPRQPRPPCSEPPPDRPATPLAATRRLGHATHAVEERKLSGWRKIAGAMWRPPDDPQVYGVLQFDATPHLELIERARASGCPVTPTHIVGKAVAYAL